MSKELQIPFSQTDYTQEGFLLPLSNDPAGAYASVNTLLYPLPEMLEPTGRYFIYLLHPIYGSCHFTIEINAGELWNSEDMPSFVEPAIMTQLVSAIKEKPQQNQVHHNLVSGFNLPLVRDGIEFYASINEVRENDNHELMPTGMYFIYLLHPSQGSCHFTLQQDLSHKWSSADAPPFVEEDIILEIGTEIQFKMKK